MSAATSESVTKRMVVPVLLVLLVLPAAVHAQGLSLEEVQRIAGEESNRLAAAELGVNAAAGATRMARAEHLPELGVAASFQELDGDLQIVRFLGAGLPPIDIGPYNSDQSTVLQLNQVLYAGGANRAGVRAGRVGEQLAESRLREEQLELRAEVSTAYYAVLLAEERTTVAQSDLARSQETREMVSKLVGEQEALQADLLGAEAQLAADEQAVQEARVELSIAKKNLNRLMGRALDSPLELAGSLQQPQRTAIDDAQLLRRAADSNPSLQQAALRIDLAGATLDQARALRRPKIALQGSYSWLDNEFLFEGTSYGLGVKLSIPFFKDLTAGSAAVAQARAQQQIEERTERELSAVLQLTVLRAARTLELAHGAITAAEKNLEYHRERYRVTQRAFQEQLATFSDLLDDHADLAAAELTLHQAHFQARLAEAELQRLSGVE